MKLLCSWVTKFLVTFLSKRLKFKHQLQNSTKQLSGKKLAIVPILRAGIGMVDGFLSLVPAAKVGHIGMYRDEETLEPVEYLVKLPEDIDQRQIFVVDPMLATGGSAILAVDSLKNVVQLISSLFAWLQHQKVLKIARCSPRYRYLHSIIG